MWRWVVIVVLAGYLAGFAIFVARLPQTPRNLSHVQGIVALTGGKMRIDVAYRLFKRGVGERLLISGVYPGTTKENLLKLIAGDDPQASLPVPGVTRTAETLSGHIDIGYAAENTLGNAREAAAWARFHRYRTILIVTARYHMPRSLSAFREAMPAVTVLPYPIEPENIPSGWWHNLHSLRVLHGEYAKYLAALALSALGLEPKRLDRVWG